MDFEQFQTSMLSDWTATLNGDAQRAAHKKAYILYWPLVWPLFFKQSNESTPRHMSLSDNAEDVNDVNVLAIFNEWLVSTHAHVFIVMESEKHEQRNEDRLRGLRGRDNVHVHVLKDLPDEYQALLSKEQPTYMTLRGEPSLL